MNTAKPIQIFRAGQHTAMSGAVLAFSESDLQSSAAAYDPAKHEAPLVVGHPKHDAPAYGWVKSLSASDGLEAEPHQVDPAFAEMVGRKAFKKISASFYSPDSPQNPVPGVYYLRHVGFLGAMPPAVKGLRNPEFADAEEGIVEFADWSDVQNASLWRRMRDFLISQFGLDSADNVIPDYAVANLEQEARSESADETTTAAPAFSDPINQETLVTPEQAAALEAENAQLKQKMADGEAREKAALSKARHTEHAAFAEGLVAAGKMLPVHKDFTVSFMDYLADKGDVIEFGEGDAKQAKPGIEGFKAFLEASPKIVEFREVGSSGEQLDTDDALAIHAKAVEFQEAESKAGRTVDIATAVAHVTTQA